MNKKEFLSELDTRLKGLPESEKIKSINFYSEMIDDHVEDGDSEEEAVASLGRIDDIVKDAMSQAALPGLMKESVKRNFKLSVPVLILLILGSPVWLSLLIALFAVIFSLYVTVFAVIISVFAVVISLIAAGAAGVAVSPFLITVNFYAAAVLFGMSLICAGLGILLVFAAVKITKLLLSFTKFIMIKIKCIFIKKEGK